MKGVLLSLLLCTTLAAANKPPIPAANQNPIATTASIVKIDAQHRMFKVKNSEHEYRVIVTNNTQFRNDTDKIGFDDFHVGESLSIWGTWNGSELVAVRISKWPS